MSVVLSLSSVDCAETERAGSVIRIGEICCCPIALYCEYGVSVFWSFGGLTG